MALEKAVLTRCILIRAERARNQPVHYFTQEGYVVLWLFVMPRWRDTNFA